MAFTTSFVTRYVNFCGENEIIGELLRSVINTECSINLWLIKIILDGVTNVSNWNETISCWTLSVRA